MRDIKPDNLLLDDKGHIHLTDFNVATKLNEKKMAKGAWGSEAYMGTKFRMRESNCQSTRSNRQTALLHQPGLVEPWSSDV